MKRKPITPTVELETLRRMQGDVLRAIGLVTCAQVTAEADPGKTGLLDARDAHAITVTLQTAKDLLWSLDQEFGFVVSRIGAKA